MAEECIFVETSLLTNLALVLHQDDDLSVLKDKICKAHLECFPFHGEIRVSSFKVRRKAQYYHLSDSVTSKLYHFIAKLEGNNFVDVAKTVVSSKKRKIAKIDLIQSPVVKVEPIDTSPPEEAKDVENGLNIEGDDKLGMLEPSLKLVGNLDENHKNDEPLKDLENDEPMKDFENPETLHTEYMTFKEIGECSKSEKPRKKKASNKTKA